MRLKERERQVLKLLSEGLSDREIADKAGISEQWVKQILGLLKSKLGVCTRIELAALWHMELFQIGLTA